VPAESHHNTFKPTAHVSQNQHRRTDSTSSAHTNEHHYRAQVPPTISQAPMMSSMVPPVGAGFTSQQPPVKNMRPMNPQAGHHMHAQQWNQYVSTYRFFCSAQMGVMILNCHLIHREKFHRRIRS
jgi:hypothetical protein